MSLDPKQLAALVAVIEHGSFSQAARALNLTLAAVSMRVQALEAQLGQRLLVRGKRSSATPAGQQLMAHARQVQWLETEVLRHLSGAPTQPDRWTTLPVAINADSLSSWWLPGVAATLQAQRLLLDVQIDDQDHTHEALRQGQVVGCVTSHDPSITGCVAQALGVMRYRCLAAPARIRDWQDEAGRVSLHRMLASPAVIFNRKDRLQDVFLSTHFGLRDAAYPRHYLPAVDAFESAIALGLGWGMVPEVMWHRHPTLAEAREVFSDHPIDVPLVWLHWAKEAWAARQLTQAIQRAASQALTPPAAT